MLGALKGGGLLWNGGSPGGLLLRWVFQGGHISSASQPAVSRRSRLD